MRRPSALVTAVGIVLALLSSCGGIDRPEGVVERWLISLNQGEAGEPELFAPPSLSDRILPEPREPNDLDVIEVGKGRESGRTAVVPFRVEVLDGEKLEGLAQLQRTPHGWRVMDLLPADPGLRVPSEGGRRIGGDSPALWLMGLGAALVLILGTWALMSAFGREVGRVVGPSEKEA